MTNKNNTRVQLLAGLAGSSLATTLVVKDSKETLLTSGAQSTEATLLGYDVTGAVVRREIVNIYETSFNSLNS